MSEVIDHLFGEDAKGLQPIKQVNKHGNYYQWFIESYGQAPFSIYNYKTEYSKWCKLIAFDDMALYRCLNYILTLMDKSMNDIQTWNIITCQWFVQRVFITLSYVDQGALITIAEYDYLSLIERFEIMFGNLETNLIYYSQMLNESSRTSFHQKNGSTIEQFMTTVSKDQLTVEKLTEVLHFYTDREIYTYFSVVNDQVCYIWDTPATWRRYIAAKYLKM